MASKRSGDALNDRSQSSTSPSTKMPRSKAHTSNTRPPPSTSTKALTAIYLSMDYGTKNLPVAFRLGEPTEGIENIDMVSYSYAQPEAPQRVAWLPNGTFLWGHHVDTALKAGQIRWDDVVELCKLALYKDHDTDPIAAKVISQLKRLGIDSVSDLIRIHFQAIIEETKENLRDRFEDQFDIDSLPIKLFINVPQKWDPSKSRVMTESAKAAGIDCVHTVYEAESATGYLMAFLQAHQPNALKPGDIILIADIGGGTGDYASYLVVEGSDEGAGVTLKSVGPLTSSTCGSELVNENFLQWLKGRAEFEQQRKLLGLSIVQIEKAASREFQQFKHSFEGLQHDCGHILIHPVPGRDAYPWLVTFNSNDIAGFFKPVMDEIIRCCDAQITPGTKKLFIPGGFGRSKYLRDTLAARYQGQLTVFGTEKLDQMREHPVARGALVRFKGIKARSLVSSVSFGIGRIEEYNMQVHRDATYEAGQLMANGKINDGPERPNRRIVSRDPFDGRDIVYDRWLPLLSKGTTVSPGSRHTTEHWQYYIIPPSQRTIHEQIYCTGLDLKEHDPILGGQNIKARTLRDGIERWGPPLKIELPNLRELGFKVTHVGKRRMFYEVYCRLVVECIGANVGFRWQLAKPGTAPYDEAGNERESSVELAYEQCFGLLDEAFNPIARTTTA